MSEEIKEQTRGEQLRRALLYDRKNGYDRLAPGEPEAMEAYCTGYKQFLDAGKTERECVDQAVALAENAGFRPYVRGGELKPGDKVYRVNRGKAVTLAVIGRRQLSEGANIGAAHIDSPRLDLKQNPLYEAEELAFLKTWPAIRSSKRAFLFSPINSGGGLARNQSRPLLSVLIPISPDAPAKSSAR